MSWRADDGASARWAVGAALALILLVGWAPGGGAQEATTPAEAGWNATIEDGRTQLADQQSSTDDLEALRERLLRTRSAAIEAEAAAAASIADARARIDTLGPPPADGAPELGAIADRREEMNADLAAAQIPLLEAQDIQRQADALIRDIDRVVRSRFAAEIRTLGPTPLRPSHWVETGTAVADNLRGVGGQMTETLGSSGPRATLARRLPLDVALVAACLWIAFSLRRRLAPRVEAALARTTSPRTAALLVNLRAISRLIVPAVGAGLLFGALDPARLLDPGMSTPLFRLPGFVAILIGAGWIAGSLFAPTLAAYRLAPLDDADARIGARLTVALGVVVAARIFLNHYVGAWELPPAEAATLEFPLFVVGGVLLWRFSRLLRVVRRTMAATRAREKRTGERQGTIFLNILAGFERIVWVIGLAAPVLAAIGYFVAASHLLYGAILSLGVLGAGVVVYDLAIQTSGAIARAPGPDGGTAAEGLLPVMVGVLVALAAAPLLALIWGSRPSDIAGVYFQLRDGMTFGGMRISLSTVVTFLLVFGVIFGLARLLQSVLRSTVLPRTRMDAGGRNAILAFVGYTGFFAATIAAVSSTGLNLTNVAVVAGALSVGIGFGLQNIVSNFVSGIILLVERPIKEGDWIEVGGHMGYVRDISVRSTVIETFDRASVILPNSDLVAGTVLNRTHTGMSGRLSVPIGVGYGSDPRQVERLLLDLAAEHPMVLVDPAPLVLFMGYGPDSIDFEIRCWLRDVNFSLSARSDLNFAIFERFKAAGVSIPFTQRVLEIRNPEALMETRATEDPPPRTAASDAAE